MTSVAALLVAAVAATAPSHHAATLEPLTDRTNRYPQRCRDILLLPALLMQVPGRSRPSVGGFRVATNRDTAKKRALLLRETNTGFAVLCVTMQESTKALKGF